MSICQDKHLINTQADSPLRFPAIIFFTNNPQRIHNSISLLRGFLCGFNRYGMRNVPWGASVHRSKTGRLEIRDNHWTSRSGTLFQITPWDQWFSERSWFRLRFWSGSDTTAQRHRCHGSIPLSPPRLWVRRSGAFSASGLDESACRLCIGLH